MNNSRYQRIIHSGLRMMGRSKLRSFFMMLSIVIGSAALTVTLTIGNGVEKKVLENASRFVNPRNIIVLAERVEADGLRESEAGPNTTFKIEDVEAVAEQLVGLSLYDYSQLIPEKEVSYSGVNHFTRVNGCRTVGEIIFNKPVVRGRFFDESEVKGSKRVAVIGPKLAKILFAEEDPIDKQFRIGNIPFTVIGIAEEQGADPHGNDLDDEIYIPITTLLRRVANIDYIMAAKFEFETEEHRVRAEATVREVMRTRHFLMEGETDDFTIITPVQVQEIVAKIVRVFKVLLPAVAAIALIAGTIVIVVLMSMSVNQRLKEIGLRKAIGAKEKDISAQFIAESVAVVLMGGVIGLAIGLLVSKLFSDKLDAVFYIPVQTLVIGVVLPIVIGLISGIFPAQKASKLNPVDSMQ